MSDIRQLLQPLCFKTQRTNCFRATSFKSSGYPAPEDGPLTYGLPAADSWYTGGSTYYSEFGDEPGEETNFLVTPAVTQADIATQPTENSSLYEALIAFFVSGAMRLALQPDRCFDEPALLPSPHSMMVQTSTSVDDHKRWRDAIRDLLQGEDMGEGTVLFDDKELMQRVADEESRWKAWHERLEASRSRVYELRPHNAVQVPINWLDVVDKLPTVFRNTNLKAVNSDGSQGQTLDYTPRMSATGAPAAPQRRVCNRSRGIEAVERSDSRRTLYLLLHAST